ncbi:MAG: methyl-accepting chemotaxis protein [SAR324 cluster bacterium]|nr:methyl-accepting chemotaxis protein [SAR324 cluster bacterium]
MMRGLVVKIGVGVAVLICIILLLSAALKIYLFSLNVNEKSMIQLTAQEQQSRLQLDKEEKALQSKITQTVNILSTILVDSVYDYASERTVKLIVPFLDDDILMVYVLNDQEALFAGMERSTDGTMKELSGLEQLSGDAYTTSELKHDEESIGNVVVRYSRDRITALKKIIEQESLKTRKKMLEEKRHDIWQNITQYSIEGVSVFVVLLVSIWWLTVRVVILPVRHLQRQVHEMASGNLNFQFDYHTNDELGDLAQSLEQMREVIQHRITRTLMDSSQELSRVSGNLDEASSSLVDEAKFLHQKNDAIMGSITQITQQIGGVAAATEQASQNIRELNRTIQTLSANIQQVENSSGHMDQYIQNSVQHVQQISSDLQQGSRTVSGLSEKMENIYENTNTIVKVSNQAAKEGTHALEVTYSLTERAGNISNITRMLEDIAAQTSMLSLNASIEAAKAGNAGQGFSVVAASIRQLASQASQSNEQIVAEIGQIHQLIITTQSTVKNVNDRLIDLVKHNRDVAELILQENQNIHEFSDRMRHIMESSHAMVDSVEMVRKELLTVNDSIGHIAEEARYSSANLDETTSGLIEIAQSSGQMRQSSNNVSQTIQGVVTAIQQISDMAEGTRKQATEVIRISEQLDTSLAFFHRS